MGMKLEGQNDLKGGGIFFKIYEGDFEKPRRLVRPDPPPGMNNL